MFITIYWFEIRYWLRNPSVYIYSIILFLMAMVIMAASGGIFGEGSASGTIANTAMSLYSLTAFFTKFLLLLIPSIIGNAVYRDYKHEVYPVLYSYPIRRTAYLFGKFLSAYTVVCLIASMVGIGLFIGTQLPGVDNKLIVPFDFSVYLHLYFVYLFPNLLFFGVVVFTIVIVSRNSYAGFISIVVLLIAREILTRIFGANADGSFMYMLEPLGESATDYYLQGLTNSEQQQMSLPFGRTILLNRLCWLAIALTLWGMMVRSFSFSQHGIVFWSMSRKSERNTKNNFGSLTKIKLAEVALRFDFFHQLITAWCLSAFDFKYIIQSRSFMIALAVGILFTLLLLLQMNPQYETHIRPLTWVMLAFPVFFFSLFINLMTFLYAGVLVHRSKIAGIHQLADATAVSNWVLTLSKFLALIKMQVLLLAIIMVAGIFVQTYNGYYHFEIGHYLFDLYGIHFAGFLIWAFAALFIQTIFTNPFLGLFILVLFSFGMNELPQLGIEKVVFRFNQNPEPDFFLKYSDLSGYGYSLIPYFLYKAHWLLLGMVLFFGSVLLWQRGLMESFRERWDVLKFRFTGAIAFAIVVLSVLFLLMGWKIYCEESKSVTMLTDREERRIKEDADIRYKRYSLFTQPRIEKVKVNMDIFPASLSFSASGVYSIKNNSGKSIDTLLVNYALNVTTQYKLNRPFQIVSRDTVAHFDILHLASSLSPGDSIELLFEVRTIPNTLLHKNSIVEKDGTFITSAIFPGLGYRPAHSSFDPADSAALNNHYRSIDADRLDFEAIVSTADDQLAITTGILKREWKQHGRNYFHYKSEGKVTNDFSFNSGCYEIARDKWKDVDLEIYYHKSHTYNLTHLMAGMKASLAYNEKYFSPYQHSILRIVEYSRTQGDYAQSFAGIMPFSEVGFITDVLDSGKTGLNLPFLGAAHETAHQWWGMQVTPADVLGSRMVTESLAEYVSLKVLEHKYGKIRAQQFLKKALEIYLSRRMTDEETEQSLMHNTGLDKSHIPYQKGALVLYAMSEYIGEEKLNEALKLYVDKVKFQEAPYTHAVEMVSCIEAATPDSLKYLINDLFKTVTLYDNNIRSANSTALEDGKFAVEIDFLIAKYNTTRAGKRNYQDASGQSLNYKSQDMEKPFYSLPLADYIEIGVLVEGAGNEREGNYTVKRLKINKMLNSATIITEGKPIEVFIDPYRKLIDVNPADNSQKL
jgi:ABC-2 type transport system permease protein